MAYEKDTYLEMIAKGITYDEMLELDEEDFKNLLAIRDEYSRVKLLEEMIEHEERTCSFRKTAAGKEVSGSAQAILDVFDKQKSPHIVQAFGTLKSALTEEEKQGIDLVEHAIYAKAASDHVEFNKVVFKIT